MIIDLAKAVRIESEVARRGGLGLKRMGSELTGACVRCGGRDRFSVSVAKQVFNCRGCGASGDVIALVQHLDGSSFTEAVRTLGGEGHRKPATATPPPTPCGEVQDAKGTRRALRLWEDGCEVHGTVAETYLRRRGLDISDDDAVLRYFAPCPFGYTTYPALIALFRDIVTDEPKAIHRIALGPGGMLIGKRMLGPVAGCAVKLDANENIERALTVGEGIETALAGRKLGFKPAWALGSAGAIRNLPVLPGIESLTILVDRDPPDARGRMAGQEAALVCSERWTAAGREVRRVVPRRTGDDMADVMDGGNNGRPE